MAVGLYADVHVPRPVILQLRDRGVNILAATEELRFRVLAEGWQRSERPFAGLVFAHQRYVSFGQMILDLELIAKATNSDYWQNRVEQLPL